METFEFVTVFLAWLPKVTYWPQSCRDTAVVDTLTLLGYTFSNLK